MSRLGVVTLLLLLLAAVLVAVPSMRRGPAADAVPADSVATRAGAIRALSPGAAGDRADEMIREIEQLGGVTAPETASPLP